MIGYSQGTGLRCNAVEATLTSTGLGGVRPSHPRAPLLLAAAVAFLFLPAAALAAPGNQGDAAGAWAVWGLRLAGVIPSLIALELLVLALAPAAVNAVREVVLHRRLSAFLAGVALTALSLVLVAVLQKAGGLGGLLGVLLLALLVLAVVVGIPAVGTLVGRAVFDLAGGTPTVLAATAVGLAFLFVASLFPILGQALFLYLCLTARGAAFLAATSRRRRGTPVPPAAIDPTGSENP